MPNWEAAAAGDGRGDGRVRALAERTSRRTLVVRVHLRVQELGPGLGTGAASFDLGSYGASDAQANDASAMYSSAMSSSAMSPPRCPPPRCLLRDVLLRDVLLRDVLLDALVVAVAQDADDARRGRVGRAMRFGNRVADVVARPVSRGVLSRGLGGRHGWAPCVFRGWGRARGARACVSRGASRGRGQRQTAVRQRSGANFWMHRYIRKLIGRRKGLALLETETVRVETGARALDRRPPVVDLIRGGRSSASRCALVLVGRWIRRAFSRATPTLRLGTPPGCSRRARRRRRRLARPRGDRVPPRADPVPRADRARLARVAPGSGSRSSSSRSSSAVRWSAPSSRRAPDARVSFVPPRASSTDDLESDAAARARRKAERKARYAGKHPGGHRPEVNVVYAAKSLEREGDFAGALRLLRKGLRRFPTNAHIASFAARLIATDVDGVGTARALQDAVDVCARAVDAKAKASKLAAVDAVAPDDVSALIQTWAVLEARRADRDPNDPEPARIARRLFRRACDADPNHAPAPRLGRLRAIASTDPSATIVPRRATRRSAPTVHPPSVGPPRGGAEALSASAKTVPRGDRPRPHPRAQLASVGALGGGRARTRKTRGSSAPAKRRRARRRARV